MVSRRAKAPKPREGGGRHQSICAALRVWEGRARLKKAAGSQDVLTGAAPSRFLEEESRVLFPW